MEYQSTILIVDDETVGRDTLEALLFAQGYHLAFAATGQEALAKASELLPDVILLDVMMPGMDGFEVCRQIRSDPVLAEVPIIMVTALDDQDSRLQGIEAGADDFVSKPFNRTELRARVRTITRLNRYRRLVLERAKFEWVVEQADDGYLVLNDDDEILYANPQACNYLGLPAETSWPGTETFLGLVAKNHYQYQPQEMWSIWPNQPADAAPRYLVQPATVQSDAFWLKVDLMEMGPQPAGRHLVRLRNVTANVLERRSTWAFHSQVSHKIRTPLSLLDGFIELLAEDDSDWTPEDRQMYLVTSRRQAAELRQNILDIFQYLKARDLVKLGRGICNINQIPELINHIGSTLSVQSIDITCNGITDISMPLSFKAVELILWELFENAQKFHPHQTPALEVKIAKNIHNLYIQVADDGVTLSSDQLAKIWTPYYQAERGFSGQVPGMGLGLSMVSSLVWSAGGTCRAFNRENRAGLVIELGLPALKNDDSPDDKD